jgi:hypothetical protein
MGVPTFVPGAVTLFNKFSQLSGEQFNQFASALFPRLTSVLNAALPTLQTGMSFMQILASNGSTLNTNLNFPGHSVQSGNQNVIVSSMNNTVGDCVIRGVIAGNGTILSGVGFGCSHVGTGTYFVTFTNPFNDIPSVTGAVALTSTESLNYQSLGTSSVLFFTQLDLPFAFMAIGQRTA